MCRVGSQALGCTDGKSESRVQGPGGASQRCELRGCQPVRGG